MLEEVTRLVAQLTAGAFAGACVYIMVAQQPVRLASSSAGALDDFRSVIPRAERVQAPLLISCLIAVGAHLVTVPSWAFGVGGGLMLAVLVQTILTVLPINRRLLSGAAEDHLPYARETLTRWGRLHVVRTALAALGAVVLLL